MLTFAESRAPILWGYPRLLIDGSQPPPPPQEGIKAQISGVLGTEHPSGAASAMDNFALNTGGNLKSFIQVSDKAEETGSRIQRYKMRSLVSPYT